MAYLNKKIKKVYSSSQNNEINDVSLVDEHTLSLYLGDKLLNKFICIDKDLKEIIVGWLIGNGYINNAEEIENLLFKNYNTEAYVEINDDAKSTVEQCDISTIKYQDKHVFDLVKAFQSGTAVHKLTSGTHCCILSINGKIELVREDIGRHNAIDKVIGHIYLEHINTKDCMIFTSGRISSDIVKKLINAKIPILVSKSVTSYQAAELAKDKLILICKAWPDSFEIYS